MSAWPLFVDVGGIAVTVLLIAVLAWAAAERGRIHHECARLRRELGCSVGQSLDWCIAMAAAAGCA
jgi:hypothetical protein